MKSFKFIAAVTLLSVVLVGPAAAIEWSLSWVATQVQGENDPFSGASGSAVFKLMGNKLTLVLTSTSTDEYAIGQLLSGVLWDQTGFSISNAHSGGNVGSADLTAGSGYVGVPTAAGNNLSGEWAWNDNVNSGGMGDHGVSSTGANGLFGSMHLFDTGATNWFDNQPPDGINASIMGTGAYRQTDGFVSGNPATPNITLVQNSMTFMWDVTGNGGGDDSITNIHPIFGTDGAFLVPEPASMMLLGGGLAFFAVRRRRRNR